MSQLSRAALARNTSSRSLDEIGFAGLAEVCRQASSRYAPEPDAGREPRAGFPIIYSESRALRMVLPDEICVVCEEQTCTAVDLMELPGDDLAFLTPNLYPLVYPFAGPHRASAWADTWGIHLVQWSSLRHDGGLPDADRVTATALLRQLARAEQFLLHNAPEHVPESGSGHRGHVGIVKNKGRRVGGSVEHDHQQLLSSTLAPAEPAASHGLGPELLAQATDALVVKVIDERATVLVPPFMRRPLHSFVVPAGPETGWLHHLEDATLEAVAVALAGLCAAADHVMRASGTDPAWNLVCHTGAGIGPLFELRPYTQPLGGYEHLGLYLCEERPQTSAGRLRDAWRDHGQPAAQRVDPARRSD